MLVGAPGLHRAVAECTQPHGPPAGAQVSKALQKYLSDVKCKDTVYKALLNRASIEPKSEVVIQKVVGVLKQFLPREVPSKEVLGLIDDFCVNLSKSLPPSAAGLKKSLGYVKATISLLQAPSGSRAYNAGLVGTRPDASPSRPGNSNHESGEGDVTSVDLLRARSLYTMTSVENGQATPPMSDTGSVEALPGGVIHRFSLRKDKGDQHHAHLSSPPAWAIPASIFPLPPNKGVRPAHARAWAHLLPQHHHSLQLLLTRPDGGIGETDVANSHDTLWDLTGQDPDELMQRLEELTVLSSPGSAAATSQKQKPNMFFCTQPYSQVEQLDVEPSVVEAVIEAVLGVCPPPSACLEDNPQPRASTGVWASSKVPLWEQRGNLRSVGQMCFGILLKLILDMYIHNGPLLSFPLAQRLLSQGLRHPSSATRAQVFGVIYNLAIHSIGFEAPPSDPPHLSSESPGNSIPGNHIPGNPIPGNHIPGNHIPGNHIPGSFPPQPRIPGAIADGMPGGSWRVPPYSIGSGSALSHHLNPPPSPLIPPTPIPGPLRNGLPPATPQVPQIHNGPNSHINSQANSQVKEGESPPSADQLNRWLLMLLYQMLTELAETEEGTEDVWQAALGCILFLTTQQGFFVQAAVQPFPLDVMSQLLRACLHFGWSMELYCHLLHLTCYLLTCPPLEDEGSGDEDDARPAYLHSLDLARLEAFGGAEELLFHFCEAPTHHTRRETLSLLMMAVKPPEMKAGEVEAMREMLFMHRPLSDMLQVALRSPLPDLAGAILSAMHDLIKNVPSSAKVLLIRLEKLALGFLESHLASDVEQHMADVLSSGGPDGLYRAWRVLQEVVECGDNNGSKLAAYCVTRLLQANSQDLQDTLLPGPHATLPDMGPLHSQHPQQQIIQVIRALLEECTDGVAIFVDMVCQLILTFKEEALSLDSAETPGTPQPMQLREDEKLLIAHCVVNTWTAALEWLLTCNSVPPSVLYRVSDMLLSTLACLPGNPPPPSLQDSLLQATERLLGGQDKVPDACWENLDQMLLPQLVLLGHVPFFVPCLQLVPPHCLVLALRSFPGEQSSIQRLLLGRPGLRSGSLNPLSVPWNDSFSSSRVALLLALVCANSKSPPVENLTEVLEPLIVCNDVQVRHLVSVQILKHWFQHSSAEYWQVLQRLLLTAQQKNDETILLNPYLQVSTIIKMQDPTPQAA